MVDQPKQLILRLDPALTQRFRCVRDVVAQGVYSRGLKQVASDLDIPQGNLSVSLADRQPGDHTRKFGVDDLEAYIMCTGDKTPILYLIERFMGDQAAARDEALDQVKEMLGQLPEMLAQAGIVKTQKRR
jgi:hypothetical protein